MMFTSPMRLLAAVALEADSEAIAKELLSLGALELVSIKSLSGDWTAKLGQADPATDVARIVEARKRVENLLSIGSPAAGKPTLDSADCGPVDIVATERSLDAIASEANGIRERQKGIQDEILKLEEIRRQVEAFGDIREGAAGSSSYSFLAIRAGYVGLGGAEALAEALEGIPSVVVPPADAEAGAAGALIIHLKRDAQRVEPVLQRLGWKDARLPESSGDKEGTLRGLESKLQGLRAKQSSCASELDAAIVSKRPSLEASWKALRATELVAAVRSSFSKTERTVLFSGWIPEAKAAMVETGIRKAASNGCAIEWSSPGTGDAGKLQAPVEMSNPRVLKPFEGLVRNFAIPAYGTVDPTPFVAVAYLMMFGLMFGDAGHGLVVLLAGLAGLSVARKKGSPTGLFEVVSYCGAAAIVAGILFGSYFGFKPFPPLWFDYHAVVAGHETGGPISSVYGILGITIKFGMAVIGLGFALNWINLVRKRDWLTLILDKGGLLGGWIYGAGAWAAFYFVAHDYKGLPPASFIVPALLVPTLALALKAPLEFAHHARHGGKRFKPGMIMDFFMEWIVEILEVYSGYLANTLSFMRVAGLGIAHVSLMTAFFQIARMIDPQGPFSIPAIAVLVAGNALVIALEGLSAGIQSLRLNYYEFFSKYFDGTGKAFRPITLNGSD